MKGIDLINPFSGKALKEKDDYLVENGTRFPMINQVYRFVDSDNYTANFGYQWNKFEKTQIDRYQNDSNQSYERLFSETGWKTDELENLKILEVGCGAGRFTEVLLNNSSAILFSLDFSTAVEANSRNNGMNSRLTLFQASIYEMPFAPRQFDKVICLGVLQHTPDFHKSVKHLCDMVKPGGELVVDFYEKRGWWTLLHSKYLFRPFTKKISHDRLLNLIEKNADFLIRTYKFLHNIRLGFLSRFLPICDIYATLPSSISGKDLKEWVILDTFDMFSPQYDNPKSIRSVSRMVKNTGLKVTFAGNVTFSNNKAAVIRASRHST